MVECKLLSTGPLGLEWSAVIAMKQRFSSLLWLNFLLIHAFCTVHYAPLGFSIIIHKYVFCAFVAYFNFTHCLDSGNDAVANNFSLNFESST